jgi:DNA primase
LSLIARSSIEEVNNRLDALAVVEDYVHLEKRGGRYWGRCPFHSGGQEKTPSFTVDPEKKMYYCFGCSKGGSIISFIMEMEKISYPEAIKILASRMGIELVYEQDGRTIQETEADQTKKEQLFELYRRTSVTFHHFLTGKPEGRPFFDYIISRGITEEMIERFRLGYAPADRNWLYRFLTGKGYSGDFLDSSGLFSSRYKGMSLFSDRLVFPIADARGRTVAFGGRALPGVVQADGRAPPKYINTPELEIFKKGQTLFAFDLALPEIRKTGEVYLAEGYMDVIALHQAGITNAVAPLGTAFTGEQAKLLRRWAEKAILVFDSDAAGQNAAVKGILTCRKNGLSCALVVPGRGIEGDKRDETGTDPPESKDPADILRNFGSEALHKNMKCFINDFDYLISRGKSLYDVSVPHGKTRAFAFLLPYLEALDSEIEREDCIGIAADAFGIDREAVHSDYKRRKGLNASGSSGKPAQEEVLKKQPIRMNDELFLLTVVSVNPELYPEFRKALAMKEIEDPAAKEIFVALEECFIQEESGMDAFLSRISSEELRNFIAERGTSPEFSRGAQKLIGDGIKRVKEKGLRQRLSEIVAELRKGERNSIVRPDNNSLEELLSEKMQIDAELRKLEGK